MQLDETRIAIRERTGLEVLDLALTLLRAFLKPCLTLFVMGVAPFFLWNLAITFWMPLRGSEQATVDVSSSMFRYLWAQGLLVFIQAPLACSLVTAFLGKAAFETAPSYTEVWKDVRSSTSNLLWCLGTVRMAIPGSLILLLTDREVSFHVEIELMLMGAVCGFAALARMGRPFLPEIIILEKNPYRSRNRETVTAVRRNRHLHSLNSGELVVRYAASAFVSFVLFISIYYTLFYAQGVFTNVWAQNTTFMLYFTIPIAIWSAALYVTLARYLNYLDQRIRYEGWEVELKLRAEGRRLQAVPFAE
jgi:hypothetical protein